MKTERQIRLESEIAKQNQANLDRPMFDLNPAVLDDLAREAGYTEDAHGVINKWNAWNSTLREMVASLTNSLFTLDGELYETTAEVEAAAKSL